MIFGQGKTEVGRMLGALDPDATIRVRIEILSADSANYENLGAALSGMGVAYTPNESRARIETSLRSNQIEALRRTSCRGIIYLEEPRK